MTEVNDARTSTRWLLPFLAAMVAALAAIVLGTTASASATVGAETRVGAFNVAGEVLVEPPEHKAAGQRLGNNAAGPEIVVATGVAAKTEASLASKVGEACLDSFTGTTLVLMADGSKKPIKDVKLGDWVMAKNPVTGEQHAEQVIRLIRHSGPHTMVAVHLADGSIIDATDHHPFWVASRGAWVDAMDLAAGDVVETADGRQIAVAGVGIRAEDLTAYNLTVSNLHSYYAGDGAVLVHNSGCDEWAAAFAKRGGGKIKTFESPLGKENGWLGPYRPGGPGTKVSDENWGHHTVVVRNGHVFDQWHPNGVGIDEFKQMFDYGDVLDFGF